MVLESSYDSRDWSFVKLRVERVEVLAVQFILDDAQTLAETLVVYDLALP